MKMHLIKFFVGLLALSVFNNVESFASSRSLTRQKRTLIWKAGASKIQVIVGIGVPVDLKQETVIIGNVIKGNYKVPTNVSQITQPETFYERRRKKRSLSRWDIYDIMAQTFQMRGFGDGKSCILRAICEMSHRPVDKNSGFFDEVVHAIFNPKVTQEELNHHTDSEYFGAMKMGEESEELCRTHFTACKVSVLDMITM